jgi:hypothetical protein
MVLVCLLRSMAGSGCRTERPTTSLNRRKEFWTSLVCVWCHFAQSRSALLAPWWFAISLQLQPERRVSSLSGYSEGPRRYVLTRNTKISPRLRFNQNMKKIRESSTWHPTLIFHLQLQRHSSIRNHVFCSACKLQIHPILHLCTGFQSQLGASSLHVR